MLKIAVCDDEPLMTQEIVDRLEAYMAERVLTSFHVSTFSNGRSLLANGCNFDLIFLDIRMEQPDGMETARLLQRQGASHRLIFVTVLQEYVFDAFEVEAFDYLLKPLDSARFSRTMDRALQSLYRRSAKSVLLQRGSACEVVPLDQIVYCEVQGRKIYLHLRDGRVTDCYDKLERFAQRMDARFFRCHRSYLVNLDCVRGCGGGLVTLPQGDTIPVSRLREPELMQAILLHMKREAL